MLEKGKRYPVFFDHYGGPTNQQVTRGWVSPLAQAIVDRGYIYFQIDNRGSDNRGVAFASQIYHAMGSVEVEDQVAGARFLKTLRLCRSRPDRDLWLVLWRLYDAEDAASASRSLRRRDRGRTGDPVGAV